MRFKMILPILALLSACSTSHPAANVSTQEPCTVSGECLFNSPQNPHWTFGCAWAGSCDATSQGADKIGKFIQTTIHLQSQGVPLTESIRRYQDRPVSLFSLTYDAAAPKPVAAFPDFDHLPANFHVLTYRNQVFSPPAFEEKETGSPWLMFDDSGHAFVISPASHFFIQTIGRDSQQHIVSRLRETVTDIPAGFTQQTLVASSVGINHTMDEWGRALTDLQGKTRPANDADAGLKYLGYWTDNGTHYYYNYDRALGYAGTLQKLVQHFRDEQIPVKYLQLDSWWYFKSFTGPDGKAGRIKTAKLPPGEWNRYGGLMEYRAHPAVFPEGLEAFQRSIDLPLITHNRWVDPASPYQRKYKIAGYAAIDAGYWREIMDYIAGAGVITYEQDWLSEIFIHSPALQSSVTAGDEFLDGMASAAAADHLTLQYCMAVPPTFMQGSKYANLTTIRCSDDRFERGRWHNFLYTSRLASSLGIWPWTDPYMTSETGNILVSDLSAGMVGFGDEMGKENQTNIFLAIRKDGVIVKPDSPIVPIDSAYIAEANHQSRALVSSTFTDHAGIKTEYVLAFRVPPEKENAHVKLAPTTQPEITTAEFTLADVGVTQRAYIYNFFSHDIQLVHPGETFTSPLGSDGFSYFLIAEPGISGIALFGDEGKFVSNGRQRIATLTAQPNILTAQLLFAQNETSIRLHGCCNAPVKASVGNRILPVSYDPVSQHFYVDVDANLLSAPAAGPDSARQLTLVLEKD